LEKIQSTLGTIDASGPLAVEHAALSRALADVQGIYGAMMGKLGESLYHAGFQGNRILFATAELVIGWLLVRQATIAAAAREAASGADRDFYEGKLAAVRFYARNVLPGITLVRKLVEGGTLELMDVSEAAFSACSTSTPTRSSMTARPGSAPSRRPTCPRGHTPRRATWSRSA
jgi:hypothetical protein